MRIVCGMAAAIVLAASAQLFAAEEAKGDKPTLKSPEEKASYAIGLNMGKNLKKEAKTAGLEPALVLQGIKDGLAGATPAMTEDEMKEAFTAFRTSMMTRKAEQMKNATEKSLKEGEAFLAANGKKEGVVTLPSGLQYKVIKEGTGATPKATDTVTTHYRGTLLDGTEFDSSYKGGEPATFEVTGVIPAWTEALQKMKVGAKWQLFVPAKLGYGERGAGNDIGPNATLIFEVELLGIKDAKAKE